MSKNTVLNRFLILILLLSFSLLNLTLFTASFSTSITVRPSDADVQGSGNTSINLSSQRCLDYLAVESVSPRFCAKRVALLKNITDKRYQALCSWPSNGGSDAHYLTFHRDIPSEKTSTAIICEFMHAKDGML